MLKTLPRKQRLKQPSQKRERENAGKQEITQEGENNLRKPVMGLEKTNDRKQSRNM